MKEVTLIPAAPEHIPAAEDLAILTWIPIREEFRRLLGDAIYEAVFQNWQEEKRLAVRRELSGGNGFVALLEGQVVGFISYSVSGTVGTVGTNAVSSRCRGLGIGSRLYHLVLEEMRKKGCTVAKVQTGGDDAHAPARHTYEKAGFDRMLPSVTYYREL